MSHGDKITKTYIIDESLDSSVFIVSACTAVHTNALYSCSGDTSIFLTSGATIFNNDIEAQAVSATTFYGDGSHLSGVESTFSGLTDTSFSGLTDNDQVIFNSSTGKWENITSADAQYINAYDSDMDGTSIPGSGIDVSLDTEQFNNGTSTYSLIDPVIQLEESGVYKIDYKLNTRGGGRATSYGDLFVDQGSGFSRVDGSRVFCYNRQSGHGYNTGYGTIILELSQGDQIKLRAFQNSGSGSEMADQSSITVSNHRGPKGSKGDKGDTGSLSGTIFTGGFQMTDTVLTGVNGNIVTDLSQSNVFNITLNGDATLNYMNISEGGTFQWIINQDGTGGWDLSYGTGFSAPGGVTPDISQTPNSKTLISGIYDDVDDTMIIFNAVEINSI